MLELDMEEVNQVNGGIHLKIIEIIGAIAFGAISGGPIGVGMALSALVATEGLKNLDDMAHQEFNIPQ